MTPAVRLLIFAAAALAAAAPLRAQSRDAPGAAPLLDVPYLPQSEALCGGAAIAMVMRFWGVTGVYAETFAGLVDARAEGIRGEDLLRALRARGFDALSVQGDERLVRAALAKGHPPVLLIEDRPGRFHYVVVVGWNASGVVVHDPARAPFRVLDAAEVEAAWRKSGYWTLLAQPGATLEAARPAKPRDTTAEGTSSVAPPRNGSRTPACAGMVSEAVRLAGASDLGGSRRILEAAASACPDDAAPWREMAGLHALRNEWGEASVLAARALDLDPRDGHAARILATSRFLAGDDLGALAAWNRVGEPVIDLVGVEGLTRTRYRVVSSALGLRPQAVLTREGLERARRRLRALPAVAGSRVAYRPGGGGRAEITAAVVERPVVPRGAVPLAVLALRTAVDREAALTVAGPLGGGEAWSAAWRWWERRPRVGFGLAAAAPFGGVWQVEAFDERQSYGGDPGIATERRRSVAIAASDWATATTRWEARASVDRWPSGKASAFGGSLERRVGRDRGALRAAGAVFAGAVDSWTIGVTGAWRSGSIDEGTVWNGRAGFEAAGAGAPLAVWPGAGTGHAREALLRAHPLLRDGVVAGGVFGRRVAHAGIEWTRWRARRVKTLRLAPAVFLDIARAGRAPDFADDRPHADLGAGLRVAVPAGGILRVDVARGLRDGEMALSFGWSR